MPPGTRLSRTAKGRTGEEAVARDLARRGWTIAARNWRSRRGEIDIIASRDGVLAFVEVKSIDAYGLEGLSASVGARKRARIIETSKLFILAHREFSSATVRFDVASVRSGVPAEYFENAFAERE